MIKRLYFICFFAAVLAFESCKNNDSVVTPVLNAGVNVVNASADTLNVYLNGTRQNNTSSLYPGSQSYYLPVPQGAENFQFKKAGTFNVLFSVPLTLKDSISYSLYVAGETVANSFSTVDFLDTTGIENGIGTRIRFVNASSNSGNLNVSIGDTLSYSSSAYKSSSSFLLTGSGIKLVKVSVTGTTTPIIDTPITFQPGRIYTLFSRGLINGTGSNKFNVGVAINY
jgi:hypothetical protein